MKKAVALILAIIVLVSTNIPIYAENTFSDTDSISSQYKEAVNYSAQAGIIGGYADGTFRPKQNLTRGAATKIIATMELGSEKAAVLTTSTAPYPDIPTTHTFAGSVAYCSEQGYISGYSDGTFKASNLLTAEAFAKMLLCAIKYPSSTGYTGTNWKNVVLQDALTCGIFNGNMGFAASNALNREQAAYLLYNAVYWKNMGASRPETAPVPNTPVVQPSSQPAQTPVPVSSNGIAPSYGTSKNPPASAIPLTVEALQGVWEANVYVDKDENGYPDFDYMYFLQISGNNFNIDHECYIYEETINRSDHKKYRDIGTFRIEGPNIIATYRRNSLWTGELSDWITETWTVEYIFPKGIRFQNGLRGYESYWKYESYPYPAITMEPVKSPSVPPTNSSPIISAPTVPSSSNIIPSYDTYPNGAPTYTAVIGTPLRTITKGIYRYKDTGEYINYIEYLISLGWSVYECDDIGALVCHLKKGTSFITVAYDSTSNEVWIIP